MQPCLNRHFCCLNHIKLSLRHRMLAAGAASSLTPQPPPHQPPWQHLSMPVHARRFFGGAFGGGFGFGGGDEEEQTPKGHDVRVDLEVSLRDLYVGTTIRVRLSRTSDPSW